MLKHSTLVLAATLAISGCAKPRADSAAATGIRFLSQTPDAATFERAEAIREFEFPRDHGVHEEFATEWWYFTGNLESTRGRHFGFELTFFRYALGSTPVQRESRWGSNQVWLAHFALTDTHNERFIAAERMGRGALGIAGAASDRLSVFVRDWSAHGASGSDRILLQADSGDAAISLELTDTTPVALHGDEGLDRKGAELGNASYYYSIARMTVAGTVGLAPDETFVVSGTAWLDREWATSSLDDTVEGWDWFGLQLDDGMNLMLYRLRNSDGSMNEFSTGTVMHEDGSTTRLEPGDVHYEATDYWTSPASGVTYPTSWLVSIPTLNRELLVAAVIKNQEFNLGLRYWEGAVDVSGTRENAVISGHGYLELAGYR